MGRKNTEFTNLCRDIIYGPVNSRRLGLSLGINLFPSDTEKICTFNCVYCYLKVESKLEASRYIGPSDVISRLRNHINDPSKIDEFRDSTIYITFSGNGEPTHHPDFSGIVTAVLKYRKEYFEEKQIAIFTNGTGLFIDETYKSLLKLDKVFIKFDAGNEVDFNKFCRPLYGYNYEDYKELLKSFIKDSQESPYECEVILQSAIFCSQLNYNVKDWVSSIKEIKPTMVQVYELDFKGYEYKKNEHFDFLEYESDIRSLFKDTNIAIKMFVEKRKYYINVYLCYAVDSLLYLPLYIALMEGLFLANSVKLGHFESPEGDTGAYQALKSRKAQFALCDPSTIFSDSDIINESQNSGLSLASIIIDKIGLWGIGGEKFHNLLDFLKASSITTYIHESTSNILIKWQIDTFLKGKDGAKPDVIPVQPGDEFKRACKSNGNDALNNNVIITADPLGAVICSSCKIACKRKIISFSSAKQINPYIFTGLLVDNEFLGKYPGAVIDVIKGFNDAIDLFYDDGWYKANKLKLIEFLKTIIKIKSPWYLRGCDKTISLDTAIHNTIELIRKDNLYSTTGSINAKSLLNAFRIRLKGSEDNINFRIFRKYVSNNISKWDVLSINIILLILWPIIKLMKLNMVVQFILTLVVLFLDYICYFYIENTTGIMNGILNVILLLLSTMSLGVIWSFFKNLINKTKTLG